MQIYTPSVQLESVVDNPAPKVMYADRNAQSHEMRRFPTTRTRVALFDVHERQEFTPKGNSRGHLARQYERTEILRRRTMHAMFLRASEGNFVGGPSMVSTGRWFESGDEGTTGSQRPALSLR
jgi:hypothetical protein